MSVRTSWGGLAVAGLVLAAGLCARAPAVAAANGGAADRSAAAGGGGSAESAGGMTTAEHVKAASWWPTRPAASLEGYVGAETCARCHGEIASEQRTSQMARTLGAAASSGVLREHLGPAYRVGDYQYVLERAGRDIAMTVSAGGAQATAVLGWAFGSGDVGQSYLWAARSEAGPAGSGMEESRFNYFASLHGFAATPGRLAGSPVSLGMAEGRRLAGFEAKSCFACHTTAMRADVRLEGVAPAEGSGSGSGLEGVAGHGLMPGVRCEACHGPGAAHVAAAEAHRGKTGAWDRRIVNPAAMPPVAAVELCGACHSTPWDVRLMGAAGVQTVRFPAYRLEGSRCWGAAGDARLTCFSCHDPHAPLEKRAEAYDTACLQCHANGKGAAKTVALQQGAGRAGGGGTEAKACPVATRECVSCHMPKVELPEMHYRFTDHRIRVARAGAPFPD